VSTLNVDKVDPSTGTTLELGTSGDTVNLGSGVTAGTGFGGDLSFGGDTFGANKVIGANDAYSFSLETSGNTALTIDANGQITKPLQPAFLCRGLSGGDVSLSGAATTSVTTWDTPTFDQNSDMGTTSFTAPVTGRYLFQGQLQLTGHTQGIDLECNMVTSNFSYVKYGDAAVRNVASGTTYSMTNWSVITDMDASDTLHIAIYHGASTTLDDANSKTYISGALLC